VAQAMRQARRYPLIPLGILIFLLVIPALFASQVAPYDPLKGSLAKRLKPPVWQEGGSIDHPLGTDKLGRDILSRLIHGARVSLMVSMIAIFVGGIAGTALGLISGYFGGRVDSLIMRLVDISLSLPTILLALVLVAAVGPSFGTVITVLVVLLWARYARLVRGETLSIRERDFIARARVAGASHTRIMAKYIFPNVVNSLVVLATLQVGYVILLESALSFLGAGLPRPTPAWGLMIADGRELIVTAWWVSMFPGLAIMLTVLALNLLGDWLRDHLDPKLRNV
jgi:peptide/nickel transport system permease protein